MSQFNWARHFKGKGWHGRAGTDPRTSAARGWLSSCSGRRKGLPGDSLWWRVWGCSCLGWHNSGTTCFLLAGLWPCRPVESWRWSHLFLTRCSQNWRRDPGNSQLNLELRLGLNWSQDLTPFQNSSWILDWTLLPLIVHADYISQ